METIPTRNWILVFSRQVANVLVSLDTPFSSHSTVSSLKPVNETQVKPLMASSYAGLQSER